MEKTVILENLDDLLINEMQHLFSAKEQLLAVFPTIIEKIGDRQLRKALIALMGEVEKQKQRLDHIGIKFNIELEGNVCKSMQGLMAEAEDMLAVDTTNDIMDAGLLATIQRIINLELANYETVCNYAYILGYEEVGLMLHDSLKEILEAQESLNKMATGKINERAL